MTSAGLPCKHCGRLRADHHTYEHGQRPDGCMCDAGTWEGEIDPICERHVGVHEYCTSCEHDRACHRQEVKP